MKKTQIHTKKTKDYDKIFKENIEALILPLAHKVLNLEIFRFEDIPDKLQRTIEREPDFLKIVMNESGKRDYILQMEFQTADEPKMIYRMLEYSAFLRRKYELTVKQFVFYIGQKRSSMQTEYADDVLSFKFNLVSIRDIPYQIFLNSDKIEEVILSILGDFENDKPETIIAKILKKLTSLATEKIILERVFISDKDRNSLQMILVMGILQLIQHGVVMIRFSL